MTQGGDHSSQTRLRADLLLLSVAIIWGSAFVAQRMVAVSSSVLLFNGLRFLLAALLVLPLAWLDARRSRRSIVIDRGLLWGASLAGLLLLGGATLQQAGLRFTTAGNAGFITGLYVVIIPIIQAVFLRRSPRPVIWAAALLSAAGLFLLSTGGRFAIQLGDALELAGAFFWAGHVLWIGRMVQFTNALQLACGQYLVCGLASSAAGIIFEPALASGIAGAAWAILYTGVLSVGLGYTLQVAAQRVAPPADAAIILSMEAVFAALAGWLFLNESLTLEQLIGSLVMLAGMLLAQISSLRNRTESSRSAA